MQFRAVPLGALGLILLLGSSVARAGGFEYGSNGAAATGRAGAFVARGDDPSALYYNVGTLGRMAEGTHILLDTNLVMRTLEFTREGDMSFHRSDGYRLETDPAPAFPGVEDTGGTFPAPFLGIVTDLGVDSDFNFGIGAFGPAAVGRARFPTQVWANDSDGNQMLVPAPQRYDLLYMDIIFIWPTLAASYRPFDDLIFGVGFQSGIVHIQYQTTAVVTPPLRRTDGSYAPVDVVNDIRANIDVYDWFVPAGLFGIWYRPIKYLELALSTRLSDSINADGEMRTISNPYGVRDQAPVDSATWTDYDEANGEHAPTASLAFGWPALVLRCGARFVYPRDTGEISGDIDPEVESAMDAMMPARREWFDIELDVTYEMNSSVGDFITRADGVVPTGYGLPNVAIRPSPDPDLNGVMNVPHNWEDTVSVRLGGDVNVLEGDLSLRWGFYYETSSVPVEWTRLDYAQWETYGVSGGLTYRLPWYGFEITAAYQHLFMPDRDVSADQASAHMLAAMVRDDSNVPTINAGQYRTSMDIFSIGLQTHF